MRTFVKDLALVALVALFLCITAPLTKAQTTTATSQPTTETETTPWMFPESEEGDEDMMGKKGMMGVMGGKMELKAGLELKREGWIKRMKMGDRDEGMEDGWGQRMEGQNRGRREGLKRKIRDMMMGNRQEGVGGDWWPGMEGQNMGGTMGYPTLFNGAEQVLPLMLLPLLLGLFPYTF